MARFVKILMSLALVVVLAFGALLVVYRVATPVSTLMLGRYVMGQLVERTFVPLDKISASLQAAVIASEDSLFCRHRGVDWDALREVMEAADEDGPARGASTISMQTAKNLFLWPSRSALRKALEIPIALSADFVWGKRRMLELYLNVAEWGDGLFGAQAAARRYFGRDADRLDARQAALLAASLPSPKTRDPGRPSRYLMKRAATIQARMRDADVACLK